MNYRAWFIPILKQLQGIFNVNNNNICLVITGIFFGFRLSAQNIESIHLLDSIPPGKTARVFAPGIISTNAIEHSAPSFSRDGNTVLWAIMKMPSYQTCLLEMNFADNKWSLAHAPSFADTTANEVYPNFSNDGDTLFFCSDRKSSAMSSKSNTMWYVIKTTRGWSEPNLLDTNSFKEDIYANSVSANGTQYFTIGPHGTSDWNIYKTDYLGKISPLPTSINTEGYEDGPFIAADESYLVFESDRRTTTERNLDLYISFRATNGNWTEPLNMGPEINTPSAERFARVSPGGEYLFFGRNTGKGFDIYCIDAGIINELKKKAARSGLLQ
jgi:hypothetical protein